MELTFSHKNIKNTSTSGTIHTEHLLNAGRRPQTSKKVRKPPHNWVGQKKKSRMGMEHLPQGGNIKRVLELREVPSPVGRSTWMEGNIRA